MTTNQSMSPKELAELAGKWIATPEGRKEIETVLKTNEEIIAQLSKNRIVDIQTLRKPLNL